MSEKNDLSFLVSVAAKEALGTSLAGNQQMKYSNKVHTAAWTTIALAILGISLSVIGAMFHSKIIGIISVFSIAICGIASDMD